MTEEQIDALADEGRLPRIAMRLAIAEGLDWPSLSPDEQDEWCERAIDGLRKGEIMESPSGPELTAEQRDDLAREIACERIHEAAGLDVEDLKQTDEEGGGPWVTVRVLVTDEAIEDLARVRADAQPAFDQPLIDADEIAEFGEVRAMAIRICEIAAMTPDLHDSYGPVLDELAEGRGDAMDLALAAWAALRGHEDYEGPRDAAAAGLLRDGWSPGEPVVRLRDRR